MNLNGIMIKIEQLSHPLMAFGLTLIIVFCFLHGYWLRFQAVGHPFHYRITDIWAAMAGIAPTLFAAANLEEWRPVFHCNLFTGIAAIVTLGLFQIAGLAAGRMDLETRQNEAKVGPVTAWNSAISILTGAYFGLLLSAPFALFVVLSSL